MNIWLINHYAVPPQYYPLARPAYFAKHLMAMGHTVTIFAASTVHNMTPQKNLISDGSAWKEETVDGVHYVFIRCRNYEGNGLKRIYNMCEFAWKLPRVCKQFAKPDAIVATSVPPTSCAMGIRLAKRYGCKGIAEIADLWPETIVAYGIAGPRNPAVIALRWLEKWIYKKADGVVFTMEGAYDYIVEQGWDHEIPRSKVHYINNGVDLEQFHDNREHYQVDDADLRDSELFKVVYTGSIRRVNNLGLLLDAAKQVTNPRVKFLIWGDGDERPRLEQRVRDEGIGNVVFKGKVEKKYVPFIVSHASLNLLHAEMSGIFRFGTSNNKLFDYLAAGKPVLGTFEVHPSILERSGCGWDKDLVNPESLAHEIDCFAGFPAAQLQEMGQRAEAEALHYDFSVLARKLLAVIKGEEDS